MTLTVGKFHCNKCELTFKGEYKPQQRPRKSCPKCHKMCDIVKNGGLEGIIRTPPPQPPNHDHSQNDSSTESTTYDNFIDDPNELLLSVAVRELNKPNPDPRWATILINCKKENINTKEEVLDQFKQLPTQVLVNILNKSLQKDHS